MINLRDYQQSVYEDMINSWQSGNRNILSVMPTGAGKTALMSHVFRNYHDLSATIAHRQELISQISVALAKNGIIHNIIASKKTIRFCIQRHIKLFGKSYYNAKAPVTCSSVDTLIRRVDQSQVAQWMNRVGLWAIDEAHHVCPDNKWGKVAACFKNAWGFGVTATPVRSDRKPLGRQHGGMFDHMVLGPTMRELIDRGYLSDYRIFAPTTSINRAEIEVSKTTGELNKHSLKEASHKSTITGDVVDSYMSIAPGKRGVTFMVDVELAVKTAKNYNDRGIPAMAVSADTPADVRTNAVERLEAGDLLQLVNVDLFGEGFDLPAIEVVSMGRPSESLSLVHQQFGRALRPFEGKEFGIILDHVGNIVRHGLPDAPQNWSLDQQIKGVKRGQRDPDIMPVRTCEACFSCYEATTAKCPYCGHVTLPASRSQPEFVDGDLCEFSPELLASLRGQVNAIDNWNGEPNERDNYIDAAKKKNIRVRQAAVQELRDVIDLWGGMETELNDRTESEAYRVFYHKFGVDVLTAQTLDYQKVLKLTNTIREDL